jgi:hypothetical protein
MQRRKSGFYKYEDENYYYQENKKANITLLSKPAKITGTDHWISGNPPAGYIVKIYGINGNEADRHRPDPSKQEYLIPSGSNYLEVTYAGNVGIGPFHNTITVDARIRADFEQGKTYCIDAQLENERGAAASAYTARVAMRTQANIPLIFTISEIGGAK